MKDIVHPQLLTAARTTRKAAQAAAPYGYEALDVLICAIGMEIAAITLSLGPEARNGVSGSTRDFEELLWRLPFEARHTATIIFYEPRLLV
jgi:hypothetical protein